MSALSSPSMSRASSATMSNYSAPSSSSPAASTSPYPRRSSYMASGLPSPIQAPRVTRYIVKTSDVLEDYRITVAPESAPSAILWHTERYLTADQIVLHLIHTPTKAILWTVLRPISTKRQGWYIRLRSPQFPEGMHIPMKPIPRASPYYVEEGCLSFSCRTNAVPTLTSPPLSRSSTIAHGYSDSASSTDSSVHSYPPTPPTMSPVSTPRSLRSISEDLLSTPTTGVPKTRDIVPPSLLISEPTNDEPTPLIPPSTSQITITSPLSQASTGANNRPEPSSRLQTPSTSSTAGGKRRAAPPPPLAASEITDFILAPLDASAALYPSPDPPLPTTPSTPSHPPSAVATLTSLFSKALNLIKSQSAAATSGTSFTLTRIPPAPKYSLDNPPPPYASTTSLLTNSASTSKLTLQDDDVNADADPTTPTAAHSSSSSVYRPRIPPNINSSQSITSLSSSSPSSSPLPPPLLTFTDTTPYLTVYANSGVLEVNEEEFRLVGVEKAFWIAVGVMYWGYMGDREGWVWAGEE